MSTLVSLVTVVAMIGSLVTGILNYTRIARRAGIANTGAEAEGRIYAYAFKEMRGSRETKLMVLGFMGTLLIPLLGFGVLPHLLAR